MAALVRRIPCRLLARLARSASSGRFWTSPLPERGVLRVRGPDTAGFLQGLITNDMGHFDDGARCVYALMLNTRGRVLFDLMVYRPTDAADAADGFLVEADRSLVGKLQSLLKIYRVRRRIDIDDMSEAVRVVVVRAAEEPTQAAADCSEHGRAAHATAPLELPLEVPAARLLAASRDPRLAALGWRLVLAVDGGGDEPVSVSAPAPDQEEPAALRCRLGVPEGADELPHGACTPLESNADLLHGVSFHKGCYVGQELTARTHHTGVVRKRVMPLVFATAPGAAAVGAAVVSPAGGRPVGRVRAVAGRHGLGLMRVAESLSAARLVLDGTECRVEAHRPAWWPLEAAKSRPA